MSSKPVFWFVVHVRIKGKSRLHFYIPLPLFIALTFADMLDDLSSLVALFCPRASYKTAGNGRQQICHVVRTVAGTLFDFLWELVFFTGPLDLLDVDVQNEQETVRIQVLTR